MVIVYVSEMYVMYVYMLKKSTLGASTQNLFEGVSEFFVEDGVDDWVE